MKTTANIAITLALFGTSLQADDILSSEDWEGATGSSDFANTAYDSNDTSRNAIVSVPSSNPGPAEGSDPTGQCGMIRGDANKIYTLREPLPLASGAYTAVEISYAVYINSAAQNLNLEYSALGDFSDRQVIKTHVRTPSGSGSPYEENRWYAEQTVTLTPDTFTFTDTARIRWKAASGSGMSLRRYIDDIVITGIGGAELEITSITPVDGGLHELTLAGKEDTAYEFRASSDLAFDPGTLVEGLTQGDGEDPGTIGGDNADRVTTDGEGNATVRMALAGDPADFVRTQDPPPPPPIFVADFEADDGGFTATGTPDDWAWGTPNSDNDAGLPVTTGNGESMKCWGTALGDGLSVPSGVIDITANSILRSPDIDLTGITGAQLQFAAAVDAATGDTIEVLVRQVGTETLLATLLPITAPESADWAELGPFDLSAADDMHIYLEFRYQGLDALFIGLYIDDVSISVAP